MSNSPGYSAPPGATSRVRLLLWAAWAVLTIAQLAFVMQLGSNCPNADEWGFVPALLSREPVGEWLWTQHNEHRLPLPRLIIYLVFQLTHDFRGGSLLQVALLSGTSLGVMRIVARLRGRPYWTDVFFPVSLLHVGHWENLLIGYNLCFAMILVLETAIGVVALTTKPETTFRHGWIAGVLIVPLCLCGGGGVVAAMPVAVWLVYLAVLEQINAGKAIGPRLKTIALLRIGVLIAFAAFPLLYLAHYLDGYHSPGHHPKLGEGGLDVLRVAGQVLAMAFGHGVAKEWLLVITEMAALGLLTLTRMNRTPSSVGVLAVASGIVGVAIVIGLGRAGLDARSGLASRYAYLTWPLLAIAYLVWTKHGGKLGKWIPAGLCLVAAIAYPMNMSRGLQSGLAVHSVLQAVQEDARNGVPPEIIVRRFPGTFQANQEERAIKAIPILREAGIGAFAEGRR